MNDSASCKTSLMLKRIQKKATASADIFWHIKTVLFSLISAVVSIGICSKASPLYAFDDYDDLHCFITVAKSMLSEMVPYRDLYEQKGPLLYMIHALAVLISDKSFIGVYLLEVLCFTCFLFLAYKILLLLRSNISPFWIPVIAVFSCTANCFYQGDSSEELCLPLITYCIYCGLKAMRSDSLPTRKESFLIGITSAFVLWIKYTMLGFYIGWFVALLIYSVRSKSLVSLLKRLLMIILGIITVTIPILIYFAVNHATHDLFEVYFYNNIFLYTEERYDNRLDSIISSLRIGKTFYKYSFGKMSYVILLPFSDMVLNKKYHMANLFAASFVGLFVFIFIGGTHCVYYSFILLPFLVMSIPTICKIKDKLIKWFVDNIEKTSIVDTTLKVVRSKQAKAAAGLILCVCCVAFSFINGNYTTYLKYDKSDYPQIKFAEIINQKQDATLLNYGFLDSGFYYAADILPNCKYFCGLNIELDEITETQNRFIEEGLVDFVVTLNYELESDNYSQVLESSFENKTYYLYQLNE